MAAQVDEHCVLASVQKVNLQCYQLGEPVTVQGLSHTGVLRDKGRGRHRGHVGMSPGNLPATELTPSAPRWPKAPSPFTWKSPGRSDNSYCRHQALRPFWNETPLLPWHNSLLHPASESGLSAAAASGGARP